MTFIVDTLGSGCETLNRQISAELDDLEVDLGDVHAREDLLRELRCLTGGLAARLFRWS